MVVVEVVAVVVAVVVVVVVVAAVVAVVYQSAVRMKGPVYFLQTSERLPKSKSGSPAVVNPSP